MAEAKDAIQNATEPKTWKTPRLVELDVDASDIQTGIGPMTDGADQPTS